MRHCSQARIEKISGGIPVGELGKGLIAALDPDAIIQTALANARANGITRYAPQQGPSFAAGTAWLDAPTDLADAVDMAVDGSVYVLRAGGAVARFADGRSAPFAADAVPGGLAGATALYGSATAGRLLVADAARGRIVALAADGTFIAQHALPILPAAEAGSDAAAGRITALQGLFWDEAEDALWWLSGPELYRSRFRP